MKIKIFRAIGPLIAALALVGLLIFLPINVGMKYSKDQLVKFAQSPLNTPSFTGYSIKKTSLFRPRVFTSSWFIRNGTCGFFSPKCLFQKIQFWFYAILSRTTRNDYFNPLFLYELCGK